MVAFRGYEVATTGDFAGHVLLTVVHTAAFVNLDAVPVSGIRRRTTR